MNEVIDSAELPLETAKPFSTEAVNKMLWNRYTEKGEYVVLFDVPNIVGLRQERRCDAVAIGMWGSTGHLIHGFEVKVSRGDWLRELRSVKKADPFIEQCDRWWLVTGDAAIAKPDEIPEAWGWMTATRNGLRIQRPAKPLPQDEHRIRRLWAFAMIRKAAEPKGIDSQQYQAMLAKERARIERDAQDRIDREVARAAPHYEELKKQVEDFERDSGMKLGDWRLGNVGKLARQIREMSEHGYGGFTKRLRAQLKELTDLQKRVESALAAIESPALEEGDND